MVFNQRFPKELLPSVDAKNIDLDAFDSPFYKEVVHGAMPGMHISGHASARFHILFKYQMKHKNHTSRQTFRNLQSWCKGF